MKLILLFCIVAALPGFSYKLKKALQIPPYHIKDFGPKFNIEEILHFAKLGNDFRLPKENYYRIDNFRLLGEKVKFYGSESMIKRSILKQRISADHAAEFIGLPRGQLLNFIIAEIDGDWVRLESSLEANYLNYFKTYRRPDKNSDYYQEVGLSSNKITMWGYKADNKIILSDRHAVDKLSPTLQDRAYLEGFKIFKSYPNSVPGIFCYDKDTKMYLAVTAPALFSQKFGVIDWSTGGLTFGKIFITPTDGKVGNYQKFRSYATIPITKYVKSPTSGKLQKLWTAEVSMTFLADFSDKQNVALKGIDLNTVRFEQGSTDSSRPAEILDYLRRVNEEFFHYKQPVDEGLVVNKGIPPKVQVSGNYLRPYLEHLKQTGVKSASRPASDPKVADLIRLDSTEDLSTKGDPFAKNPEIVRNNNPFAESPGVVASKGGNPFAESSEIFPDKGANPFTGPNPFAEFAGVAPNNNPFAGSSGLAPSKNPFTGSSVVPTKKLEDPFESINPLRKERKPSI